MDEGLRTRKDLLDRLQNETNVFADPKVKSAFEAIDRNDFVPNDYKIESYEDYALPIGFGQSISQPTTVAFMLELLNVEEGNKILDVGSGSAFTTALLAHMTGEKGNVLGIEIIPELADQGRKNIAPYQFKQARIENVPKNNGFEKKDSFDRILVNASAEELPVSLTDQLEPEGILVIPVGDSIYKITKNSEGVLSEEHFPGFSFVPLME